MRSKRSPRPLPRGAPRFAGIAALGAGAKLPPPPPICGREGSGLRGAPRGRGEEEEEEEEDAEGERGVRVRGHTHGRAASHIASQLQEKKGASAGAGASAPRARGSHKTPHQGRRLKASVRASEDPESGGMLRRSQSYLGTRLSEREVRCHWGTEEEGCAGRGEQGQAGVGAGAGATHGVEG